MPTFDERDRPAGGTVYGGRSSPPVTRDRPLLIASVVGGVGVLLGVVLFAVGALRAPGGRPSTTVVPPGTASDAAAEPTGLALATDSPTPTAAASPTPSSPATPTTPRVFRSVESSLCVEAGDDEGDQVRQKPCGDDRNQRWLAGTAAADTVVLANAATGRCLGVDDASTDDEAEVRVENCTGAPSQQWRMVPAAQGTVTLVNANSGKCLDVPGLSHDDGKHLQQYACNGGANQLWAVG